MGAHQVRRRPVTPEELKRILYVLRTADEAPLAVLAKRLNRSVDFISKIAKEHGIDRKASARQPGDALPPASSFSLDNNFLFSKR